MVGFQLYLLDGAAKFSASMNPLAKLTPAEKIEALKYAWLAVGAYNDSKTDGVLEWLREKGWKVNDEKKLGNNRI